MIKQLLIATMSGIICLVSLLSDSGIGQTYGIYEKAMTVMILLFFLLPFIKTLLKGEIWLKDLLLFLGLVLVIGLWPMFQGNKDMGIQYGWLLLVPFVVGQIPFSSRDVRTIGLVCGCFGGAVLASNLFFGVFSGWNPNSIAMAAFLGCAVCSAAPWETGLAKSIHRIFLLVMAFWVLALDSRSCFFGILPLLCLFAFNIVKPAFVLKTRWLRRLLLIAPAIIAVVVVIFQNMEIFNILNDLSQEYFGKPIFNGRNEVWEQGLRELQQNFWLGSGYINSGWWHNVAITVLTAYGIIGYLLWIGLFDRILEKARAFGNDRVLAGCTVSFLSIVLQQSFELGMVSTLGSMMPYFLLGILVGRMRYLNEKRLR